MLHQTLAEGKRVGEFDAIDILVKRRPIDVIDISLRRMQI